MPCLVTRMLAGVRSRCVMPFLCAASSAPRICAAYSTACSMDNRPLESGWTSASAIRPDGPASLPGRTARGNMRSRACHPAPTTCPLRRLTDSRTRSSAAVPASARARRLWPYATGATAVVHPAWRADLMRRVSPAARAHRGRAADSSTACPAETWRSNCARRETGGYAKPRRHPVTRRALDRAPAKGSGPLRVDGTKATAGRRRRRPPPFTARRVLCAARARRCAAASARPDHRANGRIEPALISPRAEWSATCSRDCSCPPGSSPTADDCPAAAGSSTRSRRH